MKPVDLAAHPAGKPKFQQNLEEVFVDENAVKELSEDRLKSFEDVYANGVWFLNKGCIAKIYPAGLWNTINYLLRTS